MTPPLAQQAPSEASPPRAAATANCGGNAGTTTDTIGSQESDSATCGRQADKKVGSVADFALPRLDRKALFDAFDLELKEMKNAQLTTPATAVKIAAGASLVVTAGFVSWLLRSGLLVSALLSSMPVWRGFDPLTVVASRRRNGSKAQPPSDVDLMFDEARRTPSGGVPGQRARR